MKKCLLFIFIFGITFSLWNIKANASISLNTSRIYVKYPNDDPDDFYCYYYESDEFGVTYSLLNNGKYGLSSNKYVAQAMTGSKLHTTIDEWQVAFALGEIINIGSWNSSNQLMPMIGYNITYLDPAPNTPEADEAYLTLEEYENSINPPEEPGFWDNVKIWVGDYFNDIIELGRIPVDFWNWIWGDEDIIDQPEIDIYIEPSPTPLPTETPYSTIIDPTTGEIQYKYEISGTPIITSQPPPVATYIITLPPDQGIAMPSGVYYSDDGLQDVIDAMDDNLGEYTSSIESIRDSFSTLPVKWFAFFGIPAALLIIAGVIKSLLG